VGLIAREIEGRGIPTLSMSSAWSITAAVNPPRALYLDFPLGHTTGKPADRALQRAIVSDALRGFERFREPGSIERLPYEWAADDAWKDRVMRPRAGEAADDADAYEDDRVERFDTPQYQCERDRELAEAALAEGRCETCVWVEP
jgi:D-proline reductase (dithiol) PrdB